MNTTNDLLVQALRLQEQGNLDEAARLFRQILLDKPNDAASLFSLALITLKNLKDPAEAIRLLDHGIMVAPGYAPMRALHGDALQAAGEFEAALQAYEAALKIDPAFVTALINSGVLLQQLSRHHEALDKLNKVVAIDPDNTLALSNCGILLTEFKQSEQAIAMFEKLLAVDHDYPYALGLLCFEKLHICDWSGYEELSGKILEGVRAGKKSCKTLALMAISDSPGDLLGATRIFTDHMFPRASQSLWNGERYTHRKIRVAYVSADLREHPVGHLMAGVLEHHDKSRFETIAISLGIDDNSRIRARMLKAFDRFIDAQKMGSRQIAQLMRDMEVDIAVNLSGYTSGSRTEIFALHPAPIQVNYLGYPGTMGADYMEYILADRHVIPEEHKQFYTEKVACLPDSYLPTDGSLKISERTPSRTECGLPETGFVFCSFNHDYKISPQIFAIWMRLLEKVHGSVLWLMKLNEPAQRHLRAEAEKHGIDPQRLIFATRVPLVEDHLARYRVADIFLDTYPYNAHTTAADALFTGLPVVTYMGHVFQGRVAGSLLHTLDLVELVTHSLQEYESVALKLANHPKTLSKLKKKLADKCAHSALYDTEGFCRNVESAYITMWERFQRGLPAAHFMVNSPHIPDIAASVQDDGLRLHLGGREVKPGWKIFNIEPQDGVDYVGDIRDMSGFGDETVDEIYGSHVIEHISQRDMSQTLKGFHRILKPGGRLMVSVPDLEVLCKLFLTGGISKDVRFHVMRMMFGGQTTPADFHYIGLNEEFLRDYLTTAGFTGIRRVESFGLFNDTSDFAPYGVRISLNLVAYKLTR